MTSEPPENQTPPHWPRFTARQLRAARQSEELPNVSPGYEFVVPAHPRSSRRLWKVLLSALLLVLSTLALTYLGPIVWASWRAYQRVFVTPVPRVTVVTNPQGTPELIFLTADDPSIQLPDWNEKDRVNILLLGVDRREADEIPRSDTIIVMTIDPLTKDVGMLSIPRDLLVTIPGYGQDKINAAYPLGSSSAVTGPGLVRATIEYNFGIPIHYYAEVDFEGFVRIVDTLGGVVVDVPAPIKDDEYPSEDYNYTRIYFAPGLQKMDGHTALRYVRTRHDDSDFARGYRQQQVLRALREQGLRLNLIRKAPTLINELADAVRTDLSPTQVLALAKLGTEIPRENIHSFTLLPAVSDYWEPGQPYYLLPNWPAIQAILDQMFPPREGQPRPQVRTTSISIPAKPAIPEPPVEEPTPTPQPPSGEETVTPTVIPTPPHSPILTETPTPTAELATPTVEPTEPVIPSPTPAEDTSLPEPTVSPTGDMP